jgi:hypothetical protein
MSLVEFGEDNYSLMEKFSLSNADEEDHRKYPAQKNRCRQYLFLSTFKHFSKLLKEVPLSTCSKQRLKRASTKFCSRYAFRIGNR